MNTANEASLRKCLESAHNVLLAGRQLHSLLDDDFQRRGWAGDQLERAVQDYDAQETEYRRFMMTPETDREIQDFDQPQNQTKESVMVAALTDLQIGNVMIATGGALKEVEIPDERSILNDALLNLETTTQFFKQTLSGEGRTSLEQEETTESLDASTFRDSIKKILNSFVFEAERVVSGVCEDLSELDPSTISSVISRLGQAIQNLSHTHQGIGRFVDQGIRKLKQSLEFLNQILPQGSLNQCQEIVGQLWNRVNQEEPVHTILSSAFAIESVQGTALNNLETAENNNSFDSSKLEQANKDFIALEKSFKDQMTIARRISGAVTTAGLLLQIVALVDPPMMVLIPSIYLSIIAVVILVGRDYTDADDIGCVRGVIKITEELL